VQTLLVIFRPTAKVESTKRHDDKNGSSLKPSTSQRQDFDDSLSSLSIESEDDGNLLSQAIAAGVNKPVTKPELSHPINIPSKPRPSADLCNDSISSVDSCDKDDASNYLLEQCIQSGINKVIKKDSSKSRERVLVTSSPKKSMLPTSNKPGPSFIKADNKSLDKKDEELLQECITTGIMKNTRNDQQQLFQNFAQMSIGEPKNAESTSVIATNNQCASTIAGVELKLDENINNKKMSSSKNNENLDQDESGALKKAKWIMPNGSSGSFELNLSLGSIDDNVLERSNEYPAAKLSMGAYGDPDDDSVMEMSNEFMVENERMAEAKIEDKHKDPDAMLKSVDRLTQELVSTAEYLRKKTNSDDATRMSGSISNNNTWNDENSFPSISISAPMIGSTNDEATIATDQIYPMPEEEKSPETACNLDDRTPTNENYTFINAKEDDETDTPLPKIDFKVGGEIASQPLNKMNFTSFGPASIETCSTMSNSTIVQVEAKRIANKLTSMTNRLMDSTASLDLENVRPPSSMDCISMNSFHDSSVQQSPLRQPKKLFSGLVAKRALGHQMFSASAESVNNIDSIRPPSIMDELLDSMISVDSIVSEIVDPTLGISNYETALSDMEDSLTLRSCQDLSKDDNTLTATSSDFSSVESTPKKKRNSRSLTPKQKRQSEKDRYKTYTIQVDMLLKEQQDRQKRENSETESMRRSLNARQRRQEDRQRFETQLIEHSPSRSTKRREEDPNRFKTFNIEPAEDDLSIRAMTENFEFIRCGAIPSTCSNIDTTGIRIKLNQIRLGGRTSSSSQSRNTDDSLEYERQNSETESQRDLKNSLNYDANSSVEQEELPANETQTNQSTKAKSPKISYISPYRMTTRITPMKNKAVKVTKTPVIAKIVTRNLSVDMKSTPNTAQKSNVLKSRNGMKSANGKTATNNTVKSETKITPQSETPSMPIRQGTFIQDEPTLENVPIVNDVPASPVKASISKLKPPTRVPSSSKIPTTPTEKSILSKKAPNFPSSVSQLKFRSNSNASMKSPISGPVRSNTGITLNNPKKNVTSKIAGIWKSGEKKESLLKKPISISAQQLKWPTPVGKKISVNTSKDHMKRSSTCEYIGEIEIV
jgi:hypothetical protein